MCLFLCHAQYLTHIDTYGHAYQSHWQVGYSGSRQHAYRGLGVPALTGFVIVSQSETLARGVCEVVKPMAPDVVVLPCGCRDEGLATAAQLLQKVCDQAQETLGDDGHVIILPDLGSARIAAQHVITSSTSGFLVLGHGPVVEGAAAGVVAAQQGEPTATVLRAISSAAKFFGDSEDAVIAPAKPEPAPDAPKEVRVGSSDGLGARPAAMLARMASDFDATITVNGVDATSVLALMRQRIGHGDIVTVEAHGPESRMALDQLSEAIENGFTPAGADS